MRALPLVLALAACSNRAEPGADPGAAPAARSTEAVVPAANPAAGDPSLASPASPGATAGQPAAPGAPAATPDAGAYHLDDTTVAYHVADAPVRRKGRPIEVLLRSSPAGARAEVDGEVIGSTPTLWMGEADGRAHRFSFVLPGHATATYRFVPVQSGIVHGSLEALKLDSKDAGP